MNDFWEEMDGAGPVELQTGHVYAFRDGQGTGTVHDHCFKNSKSFWVEIDRPGYKFNGERMPFFKNGRYAGAMAWALPELVKEIETDVVEVEFIETDVVEAEFDG